MQASSSLSIFLFNLDLFAVVFNGDSYTRSTDGALTALDGVVRVGVFAEK